MENIWDQIKWIRRMFTSKKTNSIIIKKGKINSDQELLRRRSDLSVEAEATVPGFVCICIEELIWESKEENLFGNKLVKTNWRWLLTNKKQFQDIPKGISLNNCFIWLWMWSISTWNYKFLQTISLLCYKRNFTSLKIHLDIAIFPFRTLCFMELV